MKHACNGNRLTYQFPFPIRNKTRRIPFLFLKLQINRSSIVCPRAKFHFAFLIVKGKPRDIDFAGAKKKSRRHPEAVAFGVHNHICGECAVYVFIRAVEEEKDHTKFMRCRSNINQKQTEGEGDDNYNTRGEERRGGERLEEQR